MMMVLDLDALLLHHEAHPASEIVQGVHGRRHMIAPFMSHLIAQVEAVLPGIPLRLPGVDAVDGLVRIDGITPVSYTHLDVYKRQLQSPPWSWVSRWRYGFSV